MVHFTLIQDGPQLAEAAQHWEKCTELALDLECENGLHHYGTYIALFQISDRHRHWIVDPLAVDAKPLIKVLENPQVQKVFHDISFDFRILNFQYRCRPRNFYDTQLAALLLGREKIGLGPLLKELLRVHQEKKFQRFDWTRRPLSRTMLNYAVNDTAHLLALKDILLRELQVKWRRHWLEQECAYLETVEFTHEDQKYSDLSGFKSLPPSGKAVLRVLFSERDRLARIVDRPVFMIFNNKLLLSMAQNPPISEKFFQELPGVHPLVKREAAVLVGIVKKACSGPGELLLKEAKLRLPQAEFLALNALLEKRTEIARGLGIQGRLLCSEEQARRIVQQKRD